MSSTFFDTQAEVTHPVDAPEVEEPQVEEPDEQETVEEPEDICKVEGCGNPFVTGRGPYGKLCEEHAYEAKAKRRKASKPRKVAKKAEQHSVKVATLAEICRDYVAVKKTLDVLAGEIRSATGSDPEEFIASMREVL